jgi:hypothetical protein
MVLLIAVVISGAFAAYAYAGAGMSLPFLSSSCVVGLQGAAVSVEVEGPSADRQCNAMAGTESDGGTWYRYRTGTEPAGAVICQTQQAGDTWTVRDQGSRTSTVPRSANR